MFSLNFLRVVALCLLMCISGRLLADETVDINLADVATLDRVLLNVGPAKAAAIVAFREANGPFKRIEDLAEVKGIGAKTLEKNRARITVASKPVQTRDPEWRRVPR